MVYQKLWLNQKIHQVEGNVAYLRLHFLLHTSIMGLEIAYVYFNPHVTSCGIFMC